MVIIKAQDYLDKHYPKADRKNITELKISDWVINDPETVSVSQMIKLTGDLDLSDFTNLKVLDCHGNNITSLNLKQNYQLEVLNIYCNQIKANLNIFSHLTKLKRLDIGLWDKDPKSSVRRYIEESKRENKILLVFIRYFA